MRERLYLSVLIGVLLCLAGWTANAKLQRVGPAMQTWEYKSLVLVVQVSAAGAKNTLYEDGKTVPGTPVTRMPELGVQGWELVSVAATFSPGSNTDTSTYVYWLKRPR
jgi:hypothetical protein